MEGGTGEIPYFHTQAIIHYWSVFLMRTHHFMEWKTALPNSPATSLVNAEKNFEKSFLSRERRERERNVFRESFGALASDTF